jgi:hypothetical protein
MNVSGLLKRLDKLESAMGQSRPCVVSGPFGSDFKEQIAAAVAAGRARPTDFFICVHRFADDWTPEPTSAA